MNAHYRLIAEAIQYFSSFQFDQPSLKDASAHLNVSEFHLQRVFSEWAGVSPKQFLQFLTKESAKRHLRELSVYDASVASGLSGASRLHDLLIKCEGVTPGEYKAMGEGVRIQYGTGDSPFGCCLLAQTERGICKVAFFDDDSELKTLVDELESDWPNANIQYDTEAVSSLFETIFPSAGQTSHKTSLKVLMKGSPFQLQVWEALLAIPEAQLSSYQQVAAHIGQPKATRAVASAIARNRIGYLIPCHRVIRGTGEFSNYRWGVHRKPAIIAWEQSQRFTQAQ